MADDDKSPEQLQQEMFDLAQVTPPAEPPAEPEPLRSLQNQNR